MFIKIAETKKNSRKLLHNALVKSHLQKHWIEIRYYKTLLQSNKNDIITRFYLICTQLMLPKINLYQKFLKGKYKISIKYSIIH